MKNHYKFPMRRYEQITGCLYLIVHAVAMPWIVSLVYAGLLLPAGIELSSAYLNLIYYAFSFLFVLCTMFRYLKASFSDFFDSVFNSLQAIILGYLAYYVLTLVVSLLISFLLPEASNPNNDSVTNAMKLNANVMFVVSILFAPVVEETLFRGALFGTIRKKSRVAAYIISALLFSVYHLWQYMVIDFSFGMLLYLLQYIPASIALCWSYEKSGSIWAPIVIHAVINTLAFTVQFLV